MSALKQGQIRSTVTVPSAATLSAAPRSALTSLPREATARARQRNRDQGWLGLALCVASALITIATTAVFVDLVLTSAEPAAIAGDAPIPELRPAARISSAE